MKGRGKQEMERLLLFFILVKFERKSSPGVRQRSNAKKHARARAKWKKRNVVELFLRK